MNIYDAHDHDEDDHDEDDYNARDYAEDDEILYGTVSDLTDIPS